MILVPAHNFKSHFLFGKGFLFLQFLINGNSNFAPIAQHYLSFLTVMRYWNFPKRGVSLSSLLASPSSLYTLRALYKF